MGAGDHDHTGIRQLFYRLTAGQRTTTDPQQWTFGTLHLLVKTFNRSFVRSRQSRRQHHLPYQAGGNQAVLNIDRDLYRHRATRHGLSIQNGALDHRDRLLWRVHPVGLFRTGAQEAQLILGFVDKPGIGVQIGFLYLTGDMQQRRIGVQRFNHRTDGVTGSGTGAGQRHPQARKAPVGISHGYSTCLTARRNKTDRATLPNGIGNRQIVDRDDAIHCRHLVLFQRSGYRLTNRNFFAHHLPSYCL